MPRSSSRWRASSGHDARRRADSSRVSAIHPPVHAYRDLGGRVIRHPRYVIAVRDLEVSARYYRDVLGFAVREVGDPGWRFFERDACFIMAGECRDALPATELGDHSYLGYLEVDEIDGLYEAMTARGAELIKKLRDEPWGMREFGIRTVDGHRFMFGQRT